MAQALRPILVHSVLTSSGNMRQLLKKKLMCQMFSHNAYPSRVSYCVSLVMKRACSAQAAAPEKVKNATKAFENQEEKCDEQQHCDEHDGYDSPAKEDGKKAKRTYKKKTKKEILADHVSQEPRAVQDILHQYSDQLNCRKQDPGMMYIINNAIADRLVQSLDPGEHHVPHLELGPGPGVLTRRLLSAGVRHITCFEPAAAFRSSVLELQEETGGAVRLTPLNLLQLPKMWGAATHGQEARLQQALDGLSWRPWHQGPCLRVVGVAHRSTFFRYLVRTVVEREHLFQFGRPELVVYVPSSEVERLTSSPDMSGRAYRPYSILSQIFFDLELLRRVPAKHFYPWMMARKRVSFTDMDMVLIRYTPKVDPGLPDSELPNLDFFIRHCTVSKRRRIVPQLEEWVPGCGPRLIALGHGVFSPFRDLTPAELLRLFLEFASWPEYSACSFHNAVQQDALGGMSEELDDEDLAGEAGGDLDEFEPGR